MGFSYRNLYDGAHRKICRDCGEELTDEPHEFGEDGVCFCGCVEGNPFGGYAATPEEIAERTKANDSAPAEKTVSLKLVIIISVIVFLIFAAIIIIICIKKKS